MIAAMNRGLWCRDLALRQGRRQLLQTTTRGFAEGVHVIVGENGAGKSTFARALVGLHAPSQGSIHWKGCPPMMWDRGDVAFVPDEPALDSGLSVHEMLHTRLALLHTPDGLRPSLVGDALATWRLTSVADMVVGRLSLGQRQRVGLAAAFLGKPGLLVMDEPWAHLDEEGRGMLRASLERFAGTVIITAPEDILTMGQRYVLSAAKLECSAA